MALVIHFDQWPRTIPVRNSRNAAKLVKSPLELAKIMDLSLVLRKALNEGGAYDLSMSHQSVAKIGTTNAGPNGKPNQRQPFPFASRRATLLNLDELVLNDADITINENVANVLSRGLSFLPITKVDKKEFAESLTRFRRLLDLRIFWNEANFRKKETIHSRHNSRFLKSYSAPPRPFIKDTNPDWIELIKSTMFKDNRQRPPPS